MSAAVLVEPKVLHVPPGRVGSYGDDVAETAEGMGSPLEPEQRLAVDALVAHDRRGRLLSVEAGVEMARQGGKTKAIMRPVMVWSCLTDPDLYTWTSHLADTHLAAFNELADPVDGLIANLPWLSRRVRRVSYENGQEGITWVNGAELAFRCRSGRRGRGRSGKANLADEALFLGADSMGALLPTLATRSLHGDARQYYASSAPKRESAYLRSLRRRALAGDPTLTYVGWWARGSWADPGCQVDGCQHEVGAEGCALDDEARWAEANILLGRHTSVEFLRTMRRSLPPMEFGREFLGWGEGGDEALDPDVWARLADPRSTPEPGLSYGLVVAPKGAAAAIVAAGKRADGLLHVELREHRPGTAWLRPWLVENAGRVGGVRYLGGKNPTRTVVPDLQAAGVALVKVSEEAFAANCDAADQAVTGGTLRHLGDPRMAAALGAVVRRDVGEGAWVMTWRGATADASPAMAMVLALGGIGEEIVDPVGQIW